ncbi:MAG: HEAT repeat domain-containing protein, partial [Myxococcota bacterium]
MRVRMKTVQLRWSMSDNNSNTQPMAVGHAVSHVCRATLNVILGLTLGLGSLSPVLAYEWPGKLAKALRALDANTAPKRAQAIRELVYFPLEDVLPDLLSMLDDPSLTVQIEAMRALQEMGAVEAVDRLQPFLKAPEPELRRHAIQALGELGDQRSLMVVTRALGDSDPRVREATVQALGRMGDEEGLGAVSTMLSDVDPQVVMAAMDVLADVGDRTAVFALLERTHASSPRIQAHAIRALGRLGDQRAVGPLVGLLNSSLSVEVQSAAVEALAQIGSPEASPALMRLLLKHNNDPLGLKLLTALGRIGDPRSASGLLQVMRYTHLGPTAADAIKQIGPAVAPKVLEALDRSDKRAFQILCLDVLAYIQLEDGPQAQEMRALIAEQLSPELHQTRFPTPDVLNVLLAGHHPRGLTDVLAMLTLQASELSDEDARMLERLRLQILEGLWAFDDVRVAKPVMSLYPKLRGPEQFAALRLMGELRVVEALPLLKRALVSGNPQLRLTAVAALGRMDGPEAGKLLLDELRSGSPETLVEVGYGLGNNTASEVTQELLTIVGNSDGEVQFTALQALGDHVRRSPNPDVERVLVDIALGSKQERVAARALDALGARPFPNGVEQLARRYDDAGPILRRKIVAVLGDWGQEEAFDVLFAATEDRSAEIRAEAAWALGRLGSRQATDRLVDMLSERNWAVSMNAMAGLARLRDAEARPSMQRVLNTREGYLRANALHALASIGAI